MSKEKRAIIITIKDVDDLNCILKAITKLFQTILMYQLKKENMEDFENLIVSCADYFGHLLASLGYDDEGYKHD